VLESSARRILERLGDDDLLLDVGGWAKPFWRADWVIDLLPYETRGRYADAAGPPEPDRFSAATWVQRDVCDREPWPFADDQFAFALCSHTLEDVRDPVWVCSELCRVARAGYLEVPSRLEEQSWGVQGPWVGWGHHHWLIDVDEDRVEFVFKPHIVHGRQADHFPRGFHATLAPEDRVQCLWWEGRFGFEEHIFVGPGEIDRYLQDFVARNGPASPPGGRLARRRRPGRRR
jgi:hypothetical protein